MSELCSMPHITDIPCVVFYLTRMSAGNVRWHRTYHNIWLTTIHLTTMVESNKRCDAASRSRQIQVMRFWCTSPCEPKIWKCPRLVILREANHPDMLSKLFNKRILRPVDDLQLFFYLENQDGRWAKSAHRIVPARNSEKGQSEATSQLRLLVPREDPIHQANIKDDGAHYYRRKGVTFWKAGTDVRALCWY